MKPFVSILHTLAQLEEQTARAPQRPEPVNKLVSHLRRDGVRKGLEKRFWERVAIENPNDCWLWSRCKTGGGYAGFAFSGRVFAATRWAYFFHYGIDPGEMLVCHKCDNPMCVNPHHLFLGSHTDNRMDCISKGREGYQKGENGNAAVLTIENVREIRAGKRTRKQYQSYAERFGVSEFTVQAVVYRKTWKDVELSNSNENLAL